MIKVNSIAFAYKHQPLFKNLCFQLTEGQVLQVIGSNGSGKTTLLKILAGLLEPMEGNVDWESEKSLLYLGHKIGIKNCLTIKENLLASKLYGRWRKNILLEQVLIQLKLEKLINSLCSHISEGQRRRVALARLLLLEAKVWILDEPFAAIDQAGIDLLIELISNHLKQKGIAIFTSHQWINLSQIPITKIFLASHAAG